MHTDDEDGSKSEPFGPELRLLLAEGLLTREELALYQQQGVPGGASPLAWLEAQGRISTETLHSLQGLLQPASSPPEPARHPFARLGTSDKGSFEATAGFSPEATAGFSPEATAGFSPGFSSATTVEYAPDATAALSSRPELAAPPSARATFLPGWDRYRLLKLLGQGGMGKVFLARDPRLQREVAIKLVKGDSHSASHRLIAEARAQARVSHANVCQVFEVGEVGGQVFIAMQYIEGDTLGVIAPQLGVEALVLLLHKAVLGVHAAHQVGIIHRDLKPSNIMVGRATDDSLQPFVMDFGLASVPGLDGQTQTGDVMGTPYYMSPEQARGELGRLDRRADVYSLGATLYHLLVGRPPIPGANGLEVISNIGKLEPKLPRQVVPNIPRDLEAIVMKCLEKEPSARYDSAQGLAEDLERFLVGEPVLARHAGLMYRLQKQVLRHRRLAAFLAVVALALLAALGWGYHARQEVVLRERLARQFTEQVERIEASARYSALSPLHDRSPDLVNLQQQMKTLSAAIERDGDPAIGPGNYALGRGELALGETEKARTHLELAWHAGFQEPRTAYALALVLAREYQAKLREVARIEQKELLQARRTALAAEYRAPLLNYLARSRGADVPSEAYVAALVAFAEERYDDALKALDQIEQNLPWFYEAPALRAEVLQAKALQIRLTGDRKGTMAVLETGRQAYQSALAIGESVPELYNALGELEFFGMRLELYGQGKVEPAFERATAALNRALRIQPDSYAALVNDASLHRRMGEYRQSRGEAVDALFARARTSVQKAIRLDGARPEALLELGRLYLQQAEALTGSGQDPAPQLKQALEVLERFQSRDRDVEYYGTIGLIHDVWAEHEAQRGANPEPHWQKAIEAFQKALTLDATLPGVWINLGTVHFLWGNRAGATDPDAALEQAGKALDKARSIDPGNTVAYFYGAETLREQARRLRLRGGDGRVMLEQALELNRAGLRINPALPHLHNGAGSLLLGLAQEAWEHGEDPMPRLHEALAAFEQAIRVAPEQGYAYHNVSEVQLQSAGYLLAQGENASAVLKAAEIASLRATTLLPDQASPWVNLGRSHVLAAEYRVRQRTDASLELQAATSALEKALRLNPSHGSGLQMRAGVASLRLRQKLRQGRGTRQELLSVVAQYQAAIQADQEWEAPVLGLGWLYWHQAAATLATNEKRHTPPSAEVLAQVLVDVQAGLTHVDSVLKNMPRLPEARLLRGALLEQYARTLEESEAQRQKNQEAQAELKTAFAIQSRLKAGWLALKQQAGD